MTKIYLTPEMTDGRFGASIEAELDVSLSSVVLTAQWAINGPCMPKAIHVTDGLKHRRTAFTAARTMMEGDVFTGTYRLEFNDTPHYVQGPMGPMGPPGPPGPTGRDGRDGRDADEF
jgi:hypothetical protein